MLNDGVWMLLVLWAFFSWQWYAIHTSFFLIKQYQTTRFYAKSCIWNTTAAQLDLLSCVEANNLQNQRLPGLTKSSCMACGAGCLRATS